MTAPEEANKEQPDIDDLKLTDIERILLDYKYESKSKPATLKAIYSLLASEAVDVYWEGGPLGVVPLSVIKELFGVAE